VEPPCGVEREPKANKKLSNTEELGDNLNFSTGLADLLQERLLFKLKERTTGGMLFVVIFLKIS
jgi:hypothetical protein